MLLKVNNPLPFGLNIASKIKLITEIGYYLKPWLSFALRSVSSKDTERC